MITNDLVTGSLFSDLRAKSIICGENMTKKILSILLILGSSLLMIGCATSVSIPPQTSTPSSIPEQAPVNTVIFPVSPSPTHQESIETITVTPTPSFSNTSPSIRNAPPQTPFAPSLNKYKNMTYYYSISYPSEWIVDEDIIYLVLIDNPFNQTSKLVMKSQMLIEIEKIEVNSTVNQFLDLMMKKRSASPLYKNWNVTSSQEINNGPNKGGYRVEYSCIQNTENKTGIGIAIKKGGYGYYAQFEVIDSEWESWKSTANTCLDNFTTPNVATGSYSDSNLKYSLSLPTGWSAVETSIPERPISFSPPVNQPVVVGSVNIVKIDVGTTAQDYLLSTLSIANKDKTMSIAQQGGFKFANGRNGYEVQLLTQMGADMWKIRLIAITQEDRAILLMFTGKAVNQDSQFNSVTQLAQSLDFQ
jgi:hypothetical protein